MTNPYAGNDDFNADQSGNSDNDNLEYKVPPMGSMPAYNAAQDPSQPIGPARPGAGIRLVSFIIDLLLTSIVSSIIMFVLFRDEITDYLNAIIAGQQTAMGALPIYSTLITLVVWFVYRAGMESSSFGGSLGKIWTNQRVTNFEGGQVTFVQAATRNVFYLIENVVSMVPIIGFLLGIIYYIVYGVSIKRDPNNQSQADRWAKAYVVYRK